MAQTLHPPPVALQGVATPWSGSFCRVKGVATVSQLHPPKGPVAPHPEPPCRVSRVVWASGALSRSRGCSWYPCGCRATLSHQGAGVRGQFVSPGKKLAHPATNVALAEAQWDGLTIIQSLLTASHLQGQHRSFHTRGGLSLNNKQFQKEFAENLLARF